jgi:hypothetical protein
MDDLRYHLCPRDERDAEYDGHGIFLCYTCDKCRAAKMRRWRSDIHERYECDEEIYGED